MSEWVSVRTYVRACVRVCGNCFVSVSPPQVFACAASTQRRLYIRRGVQVYLFDFNQFMEIRLEIYIQTKDSWNIRCASRGCCDGGGSVRTQMYVVWLSRRNCCLFHNLKPKQISGTAIQTLRLLVRFSSLFVDAFFHLNTFCNSRSLTRRQGLEVATVE